MKKKLFAIGAITGVLLLVAGCSSLEFKRSKEAGKVYYVSVQSVPKHQKPCASSKIVGTLKIADTVTTKAVVPLSGHLLEDQADSWIELSDGSFIPGNTVISQELWEAQLNGLPPRGGVKVKNFTSSQHQDSDGSLDMARLTRRELVLLLGANGSVSSKDGKSYATELTQYIIAQNPASKKSVKMPVSKRSILDFPPLESFVEIGPYQEFDMGAGLAAYMLKDALAPNHPITRYVSKIVARLLKKSTLPYAYSGYNVIVLNDDKTVNACAAPGGFIFVTTGMIKYLNSEEELALILAHEIGHLEFHHSVRELGATDYAGFALAALTASIDLKDPDVIKKITDIAVARANLIPFFDKLSEQARKERIASIVKQLFHTTQIAINEAKDKIAVLLKIVGGNLEKGHSVEFEAAADRRAVSLATAAGYDADALLSVLARIKKDNNGFGEAYPGNRDELVKVFKADFKVAKKAAPAGNYSAIKARASKITKADLFIKK